MGANILYVGVSFDRKLHINEQSICGVYIYIVIVTNMQTVGTVRELFNCRDGVNMIEYLNYDEVTLIIEEVCTN